MPREYQDLAAERVRLLRRRGAARGRITEDPETVVQLRRTTECKRMRARLRELRDQQLSDEIDEAHA
eukprot:7945845-Pyramimonas_sp.AAC.1